MKSLRLLQFIIPALLVSCAPSVDLNRKPDREVTVINSKTNQPVPGCELVYWEWSQFIFDHYFYSSRPYVTDENGVALVPSGVVMNPDADSGYTRHRVGDTGFGPDDKTIYVLPVEDYKRMKFKY